MPQVKVKKKGAVEAAKAAARAATRAVEKLKKKAPPPKMPRARPSRVRRIREETQKALKALESLREHADKLYGTLARRNPKWGAGQLLKALRISGMEKVLVAGKPVYKDVVKYLRLRLEEAMRTKNKEKAFALVNEAREKMKRFADFVAAQRMLIAAGAPRVFTQMVGYSFRFVGTKEQHRSDAVLSLANLFLKNRELFAGNRMLLRGTVFSARYILTKGVTTAQATKTLKDVKNMIVKATETITTERKILTSSTMKKLLSYRPRVTVPELRKEYDLVLKELDKLVKRVGKVSNAQFMKESASVLNRVQILLEKFARMRRPSRNRQQLYARMLSALREGKTAEFTLQRALASEYSKIGKGKYAKKILDYSSKLQKGQVKAEDVMKFLAKHFTPLLQYHIRRLKELKVPGTGFEKGLLLLIKKMKDIAKVPKTSDIPILELVRTAITDARTLDGLLRTASLGMRKKIAEIYSRSMNLLLKGKVFGAAFQRSLAGLFAEGRKEERDIHLAASKTFEKTSPSEAFMRTYFQLYRNISFLRISSRRGSVGAKGRKIARESRRSLMAALKVLSTGKVDAKYLQRVGAEGRIAREYVHIARRLAPGKKVKGRARRRRIRDRDAVISIYGRAIAAVRKGKMNEARVHLKLARAYMLSRNREDRRHMAKISSSFPKNASGLAGAYYSKARAERILRDRRRKVGRKERKILDRMRKNVSVYHDLAIAALQRGMVSDVPWVMRAAQIYAKIALLSPEQREKMGDALKFIHKILGNHQKVRRGRRYVYTAAKGALRRRAPRRVDGEFPNALVASKTYSQHVGAKTIKDAQARLMKIYSTLNLFGERMSGLLFNRALEKIRGARSAFEKEKKGLDKLAAAAEKKKDKYEAERLRREASVVDFSRIRRIVDILQQVRENADKLAKTNPKRAAFLRNMAERGLAALDLLKESVANINTIERTRGRRELLLAAETLVKIATAKRISAADARRMLQRAEIAFSTGNEEVGVQYRIKMRRDAGIRAARRLIRRNKKNKKEKNTGKHYKGEEAKKEARKAIYYYRRERFGVGAFAVRRTMAYVLTSGREARTTFEIGINDQMKKNIKKKHLNDYYTYHPSYRKLNPKRTKEKFKQIREDIRKGRLRKALGDLGKLGEKIDDEIKKQRIAYMGAWGRGTESDARKGVVAVSTYFGFVKKPTSIEAHELRQRKKALVPFLRKLLTNSNKKFINKELKPFLAKLKKKGITYREVAELVVEWQKMQQRHQSGERARNFAVKETIDASVLLTVAQLHKRVTGRSNTDLVRTAAERLQLARAAVETQDRDYGKDFAARSVEMPSRTLKIAKMKATAEKKKGVFGVILANQRDKEWKVIASLTPLGRAEQRGLYSKAGRLQRDLDLATLGYEYSFGKIRRRRYTPKESRRVYKLQEALATVRTGILYSFPMAVATKSVFMKVSRAVVGPALVETAGGAKRKYAWGVYRRVMPALGQIRYAYDNLSKKTFQEEYNRAVPLVDRFSRSTEKYVTKVRVWGEWATMIKTGTVMAISMIPKVGWIFGAIYFGYETIEGAKDQVRAAGGLGFMTDEQKRSLAFHTFTGLAFSVIPVGRFGAAKIYNRMLARTAYKTLGKSVAYAAWSTLPKVSHLLAGVIFANFTTEVGTMLKAYQNREMSGYGLATAMFPQVFPGLSLARTAVRWSVRGARAVGGLFVRRAGVAPKQLAMQETRARSSLQETAPSPKQKMRIRRMVAAARQYVRRRIEGWRQRRLTRIMRYFMKQAETKGPLNKRALKRFLKLSEADQNKLMKHFYEKGREGVATRLAELRILSGKVGRELESAYGVRKGRLKDIYTRAGTLAEARQRVADALGIKLEKMPKKGKVTQAERDLGIVPEWYDFKTLADDGFLFGMLTSGNLLKAVGEIYPGAKVVAIEFLPALLGAYKITVMVKGKKRSLYVKRIDLGPDRAGSAYARRSGTVANEVVVRTKGGRPLKYTTPDGKTSRYGIVKDIGEWEGTVMMNGKKMDLKTRKAVSIDDMKHNPAARRHFAENVEVYARQLGYEFMAFLASGGFDRSAKNMWDKTWVWKNATPGKVFAMGYRIVKDASGKRRLVKRVDKDGKPVKTRVHLEMDAEGNIIVKGKGHIDTDPCGGFKAHWDPKKGDFDFTMSEQQLGNQDMGKVIDALARAWNRHAKETGKEVKPIGILGFEIIQRIFGTKEKEGPFYEGVRMWWKEVGRKKGYQEKMAEAFKRQEGKPVGVGSPVGTEGKAKLASDGMYYMDRLPFNGESGKPVYYKDGRSRMRTKYEIFSVEQLAPNTLQTFIEYFPQNKEVFVVPLSKIPSGAKGLNVVKFGKVQAAVFSNRGSVPKNVKKGDVLSATRHDATVRVSAGFGKFSGVETQPAGAVPVFRSLMGKGPEGSVAIFKNARKHMEHVFSEMLKKKEKKAPEPAPIKTGPWRRERTVEMKRR